MSAVERSEALDLRDVELALGPVLELAHHDGLGEVPPAVDLERRAALLARLQPRAPRRGVARWGVDGGARWGFAFGLVAAAIVAFVWWRVPARPLAFSVNGTPVKERGSAVIRAMGAPQEVDFADGTRVSFAERASGRVADVTAHGARVIVADGHAHFEVAHLPGAEWSVEAGKYVIRVTGTEFDVDWSASRGVLRVTMQRGSVVVDDTHRTIALRAGESIALEERVAAPEPSTAAAVVGAPSAEGASTARPAGSTSAPLDSGPAGKASDVAPAQPASKPRERWSARVSRGDYGGVIAEATALGVTSVIASAPLDDLAALEEAARYDGKLELARHALEGERSRFPGSTAAHTAAFLLGRMADDRGSLAEAISLYDEYLATGGTFAAEALGRKMIVINRSSGPSAAEPLARHYLESYPSGSYAGAAHLIVGDP